MNWRWLVALPLVSGVAAAESAQKLTVQQAVQLALQRNTAVDGARARQEIAADNAKSSRGRLAPNVHLSDEQQHYNGPFAVAFPLPPKPVEFVVRDVNTNTFVASADQPLLGLLHRTEDYSALNDTVESAAQQVHVAEAAVREGVETQYLRLFEARATEGIAQSSQQQLAEQVAVAKSKLAAGVLTTADVLRLEVAVANAKQQEIQAQVSEQVSRAAILTAIGAEPTDTTLDFEEPKELEKTPGPSPSLADAFAQAQKSRPELAAARLDVSAAEHRARSRLFGLLPELDLEGAYLHITGQAFAQVDSAYIGLKADWNIFTWGADWYAHKAADEQAAVTSIQAEDTRRQIGLDLSARLSQERAAASAVDVAETAITSAEEAYRVTDALVKAGSATTTDLLDAQSALTQARLNLVRARYEQAIARVAVKRAIGSGDGGAP